MTRPSSTDPNLHDCVAGLLAQAELHGPFELVAVAGGANNKAYRVDRPAAAPLFVKEYFRHADDPRDRLGTEFAFTSFAWAHGLRRLARPYAMDRTKGCALYAYLEGRKPAPDEVTAATVMQSLRFLAELNAHKGAAAAARLPNASEACFSLEQHVDCLRRRLRRLQTIGADAPLESQAQRFVDHMLVPAAAGYLQAAIDRGRRAGIELEAPLDACDRCLSPSDFGFHNALAAVNGDLYFLDFEYAGWDDPAKTVCDFFCQPACPAPAETYAVFAAEVAAHTQDPVRSRRRFDLLLPIYRLKWCCIMLNDFLPTGAGRRRFALSGLDALQRKKQQLHKAEEALRQFRRADLAA